MSLRNYLVFMGISTLLCWGAWGLVIFNLAPENTGFIGLFAFYLTLLFALTGTFFFVSFIFRRFLNKESIVSRQVGLSFRQAISFAIIVLGALFLQSRGILNWGNILLLILALTVLEIFFVSRRKHRGVS